MFGAGRPRHRLALLAVLVGGALCAFFGAVAPAGATTCSAPSELWDEPVTSGRIVNAYIGGEVYLDTGSVTAVCNSSTAVATITGTIYLANDATRLNVTINYKDKDNWTLTIAPGATPSGYKPQNWAGMDLRYLSGTIIEANGSIDVRLNVSNYVMGSQVMDLAVVIDPSRKVWAGSATLSNTHIGGLTINQVTIATTSTGNTAYLSGSLTSHAGTFAASVAATGINSSEAPAGNPLKWGLAITLSGANLNGSVSTVRFNQFSASAQVGQADASSCIDVNFAAKGTWVLEGVERAINDFSFKIHCQTLKHFNFSMSVGHDYVNGGYIRGTLWLTWYEPGSTQLAVDFPWNDTFYFYGGLLGEVDLSYTRHFSEKYTVSPGISNTFSRDITVGIGVSTGLMQWTKGQTTFSPFVEVGGWLSADRVDGDIYCSWIDGGTEFTCSSDFKWDPEDAGRYDHSWSRDL